ncbi:hypothetical protein [Pedobacter helvus]|uniref:Uncharacterized protein n=1 Tax=Pedobacter helvus TaxID=2563444 RepID=A0ABW9JD49_9SPHI|nr:hypothetical protein [Pedobacter ureilyticus]
MVEIFKTDVKCPLLAQQIITEILVYFIDVEVSFDLEDKDCIFRLSTEKTLDNLEAEVCKIIEHNGCCAELLTSDFSSDCVVDFSNSIDHRKSLNAFLSIF